MNNKNHCMTHGMFRQSLNGVWDVRIGKGKFEKISVPFSRLAVGHSECVHRFDLEKGGRSIYLKFCGITYYAKVFLNDVYIGDMRPYCEYSFDITSSVKEHDNVLAVELEDITPAFGPTAGWENFGGIIRDVEILCYSGAKIEDVFFHSKLSNYYQSAHFTIETKTTSNCGELSFKLFHRGECVFESAAPSVQTEFTAKLESIALWSPESPELYELCVELTENGKVVDSYNCRVGFREFSCDKHRFLLNGKPVFLKGVCKHEMIGDSGHTPTERQIYDDLAMIKQTGCNFVRLVHYPHNKKTLEIADELGLMVSEEPGLWWSDTSNPEVSSASLEVLRATILRDRNHPSIVFWLCFNECKFTEQYLLDSARVCRENDRTRLVSGANCMSDEDTLKYFNMCNFDFYTMHPYAPTPDRAKEAAKVLCDKPLMFTEWGGYFVYGNPQLLKDFISDFHEMYTHDHLAGISYWEWSELNDFNRGKPACTDGNLAEGLVDKYRNPQIGYYAFKSALENIASQKDDEFWIDFADGISHTEYLSCIEGISYTKNHESSEQTCKKFNNILKLINTSEQQSGKPRYRALKNGPVLQNEKGEELFPLVIDDQTSICVDLKNIQTEKITILGMTSFEKGYPLGGAYGEAVAYLTVFCDDGEEISFELSNGTDITTVFALNQSSMINPVAENSKRAASFGYDKNFEQYILNRAEFSLGKKKNAVKALITSANNGYSLLVYGISCR